MSSEEERIARYEKLKRDYNERFSFRQEVNYGARRRQVQAAKAAKRAIKQLKHKAG